ncbi:Oxoglutarate and iron-dependent oxygenase degradation C-term-domain-containing protein [Crepidotus variabilis]|uniref:uS12 prolyl 3,4-dihydroxylase n=1 Tax=Crepidotus variabilis TaxID=179855 RepID=A0A9P6JW66_9AGAR|nr:Oxoglutarate and iron-dependent oxygenase degradation C-term-domain-containing protein [Crepidotus variabilis]
MARTRDRSPSPSNESQSPIVKRLKTAHVSASSSQSSRQSPTNPCVEINTESLIISNDPTPYFANDLFDHSNIARLNSDYLESKPFKYAIAEKLFQDDLLRKVKDECLGELSFTEKETDIYKVNQTGDLASLNFLSQSQLTRLPSLLALRDALYSQHFRNFLRAVTGCGPLSGKKQDMSVNTYTRGCHLLNHDDVIGSRRVSYILYMPLPHFQMWQKDWGGALELYPVKTNDQGQPEPLPVPAKSISPSWNQFIFFEVQPGKSFHSVEEVVVGGDGDGRERLSISGWFHAAQEGEEGYALETAAGQVKSSREQLTSSSTLFKPYPERDPECFPDASLSEDHSAFLAEFLNPVYLQARTMKALATRFVEESSLELHSFLNAPLAAALETRLRDLDTRDGLGEDRALRMPPHTSGTAAGWTVKGPPHKWRYCTLRPLPSNAKKSEAVSPRAHASSADEIMRSLQNELFPSPAFRAWLAIVSRLMPMQYAVEARRFRPGLDYTLATSDDREARLDAVLGLTPPVREPTSPSSSDEDDTASRGRSSAQPPPTKKLGKELTDRGWATAEWGGWECYMAPHNEEDDPAIYRSSTHKKQKGANSNPPPSAAPTNGHSTASASRTNGHASSCTGQNHSRNASPSSHLLNASMDAESTAMEEDHQSDVDAEEEDSTLLTVQPGYNRLLLVLRDERVMRFVKYVSAAAEGSRWDICGEYEVGMLEQEDDSDGSDTMGNDSSR